MQVGMYNKSGIANTFNNTIGGSNDGQASEQLAEIIHLRRAHVEMKTESNTGQIRAPY